MNIWETLASKFKAINVKTIVIEVIRAYEDEILTINTVDQLYNSGELSDGSFLDSYSPYTVELKKAKGQRVSNMTLNDTGAFYESFKMKVTNNDIKIYATDPKTDELVADWTRNIFGLTEENWLRFVDAVIIPNLFLRIERALAL